MYDPDGSVPAETSLGRLYEESALVLLQKVLGEPKVFLDVGSHYGFFSLLCMKLCCGSEVHAFEPNRRHIDVFDENLALNGITDGVHTHEVALSNHDGVVEFFDRTLQVPPEKRDDAIRVRSVVFDDYAIAHGIRADVAKIDVHGAEQQVLEGMRTCLRDSISHLFVELHAKHLLPEESTYDATIRLAMNE
jgi:FkbM family methyltransferase